MRTDQEVRYQEKSFPREETLQKMLYYFRHLLLYGDLKTALSVINNDQQIHEYSKMLYNLNIIPDFGEKGNGAGKNEYFGKTKLCNLKEQVCRLYSMTSGTMRQMAAVVVVLSLLCEHGELNMSAIAEKAKGDYGLGKTITELIPRMKEAGLVVERIEGRLRYYRLSSDVFEAIIPEDMDRKREVLLRIEEFWSFALQAYPYSGVLHSVSDVMSINKAYYLDESTEAPKGFRVSKIQDSSEVEAEEGGLQYDNTSFHQVIDEFNVWMAYEAYRKRKWLRVRVYNKTEKKDSEVFLFPIRVICDMLYGRSYILGYGCESETDSSIGKWLDSKSSLTHATYRIIKVSDIGTMEITEENVCEEFPQVEIDEQLKYAWNVAVTDKPREKTHVHLRFREDPYTRRLVENQGRHGAIGATKDGWFDYEIDVWDANEMKPWLRTFGQDVVVVKPEDLRETMVSEYEDMLAIYEGE